LKLRFSTNIKRKHKPEQHLDYIMVTLQPTKGANVNLPHCFNWAL